jgi:putative endonuclease
MSMTSYERGLASEHLACRFLRTQGYKCLKHRYRCPVGEIDLLMAEDCSLVLVEVKCRTSYQSACQTIAPRQQQRILAASQHFRAQFPELDQRWPNTRVDAVFMDPKTLYHLPNAWDSSSSEW